MAPRTGARVRGLGGRGRRSGPGPRSASPRQGPRRPGASQRLSDRDRGAGPARGGWRGAGDAHGQWARALFDDRVISCGQWRAIQGGRPEGGSWLSGGVAVHPRPLRTYETVRSGRRRPPTVRVTAASSSGRTVANQESWPAMLTWNSGASEVIIRTARVSPDAKRRVCSSMLSIIRRAGASRRGRRRKDADSPTGGYPCTSWARAASRLPKRRSSSLMMILLRASSPSGAKCLMTSRGGATAVLTARPPVHGHPSRQGCEPCQPVRSRTDLDAEPNRSRRRGGGRREPPLRAPAPR